MVKNGRVFFCFLFGRCFYSVMVVFGFVWFFTLLFKLTLISCVRLLIGDPNGVVRVVDIHCTWLIGSFMMDGTVAGLTHHHYITGEFYYTRIVSWILYRPRFRLCVCLS